MRDTCSRRARAILASALPCTKPSMCVRASISLACSATASRSIVGNDNSYRRRSVLHTRFCSKCDILCMWLSVTNYIHTTYV